MKLFSVFVSGFCVVNAAEKKTKCGSCESLALGIKHQLERTKKSNFGGGNTRWEEKKLGKWATSETRLGF